MFDEITSYITIMDLQYITYMGEDGSSLCVSMWGDILMIRAHRERSIHSSI